MPLKGFRACACVIVLLAGGCAAQPAVPAAVSLTRGSGLAPRDDIDNLDVAIDAAGDVHVVWRERSNAHADGPKRERIVYRRGSGTPLRWAPAIVVAQGARGSQRPRIVVAGDGVHIVSGPRLHHWSLAGAGAPPRDLGDMLAVDGPQAGTFDLVDSGNGLLVLFAVPGQGGHAALEAMRWTAAGPQAPVPVATFQDSSSARPQLLGQGDRWIALWANNALVEFRDPRDHMMAIGLQADLRMASTPDGGATWDTRYAPLKSASEIAAISATGAAGSPTVFVASGGLYEGHLDGRAWTAPMWIAAHEPGFFVDGRETSAVATVQCDGRTAVAWVDARNRHSDRRPWNPLGGFPWGDDPEWDDNDLFLARDLPQSASAAAALSPLRLTADLSMTTGIAMVARDGQLLVFRSGRARVHKAPDDADAPPEVTQSSIRCR
jgi:hypothetical protein